MSSTAGIASQVHHDGDHSNELPPLPAAPPSKVLGQGYSAANPIPTIEKYQEERKRHAAEAEEYAALMQRREDQARSQREAEIKKQEDMTMDSGNDDSGVKREHLETAQDGRETSGAKNQQGMSHGKGSGKGANEKSEMMDRMNANQCKFTFTILTYNILY